MDRTVTLYGTLEGPIWWPVGETFQRSLTADLTRESRRIVNGTGSGLIDGLLLAIGENDGDFQSARLTADSYISITHTSWHNGTRTSRKRIVKVTDLPSIAAYVDPNAWTFGEDGED